jgi:hypothetical protein
VEHTEKLGEWVAEFDDRRTLGKLQAPTSKVQRNKKQQIPGKHVVLLGSEPEVWRFSRADVSSF